MQAIPFSPSRLSVLMMGLLITVLAGGGLAWGIVQAQTPSPTIYACVASSGNVRIVSAGEACKNNETATSWSQQGPQGLTGAPGPEGPKGETGEVEVTVHLEDEGAGDPAAPINMFLQLDGIPGEATDEDHAGQIEILAWSWGMSNSGTAVGGGGAAGRPSVQDLSLTKVFDKSSPRLQEALLSGRHIPRATLVVRQQSDDGQGHTYLVIQLDDILVTSVSTGGSNADEKLTENVSLNFARYELTYTEQNADGSAGDTHEVEWDIAQNR